MLQPLSSIVADLPDQVPTFGNQFTRNFGRFVLRLFGWKIVGQFPNEKKMLVALAPHTSNWDFVIAMFGILAAGIKVSYLMKKEAFFWPFRDLFIWLGGIPLDRGSPSETVEQIEEWFANHEQVCVAITPEGTRSKVKKWKTGFLRIAEQTGVPIFIVAWDFPNKRVVLDKCWTITSDDHNEEAEKIRAYVNQHYRGRHPEKQ